MAGHAIFYLEEANLLTSSDQPHNYLAALFRYDLDPAGVKAESTLARIPDPSDDPSGVLQKLEETAERVATMFEDGVAPHRLLLMADRC